MIPKAGYEFVSGGAGDEWTLRENRSAFNNYHIAAKRLVGLTKDNIDISTQLLGLKMQSPIMVAPMGAQGVESVINFLNNDLKSTMLLTGAAKLSDLNPDYIEIVGQNEEYSTFQG